MQEELTKQAIISALNGDYRRIKKTLNTYGDWEEVFRAMKAGKIMSKNQPVAPPDPQQSWEKLSESGLRFLSQEHPNFPPQLKHIPKAPFGIYIKGELPTRPGVAIVGTRKATPNGKQFAEDLGAELAQNGLTVISGLAFGIDSAAHRGAVRHGSTVAVLVGGADKITPRSQHQLGKQVLEHGAVVSEYPPGTRVYKHHFLSRNRIISGLSLGVVVIEAPKKSGALSTAEHAKRQEKDVFAVPGPYNHKNYAGTHKLIRSGATLAASPSHVVKKYSHLTQKQTSISAQKKFSEHEQKIISELEGTTNGLDKDSLLRNTSLNPSELSRLLSMLTLDKHINEEGGRYYLR